MGKNRREKRAEEREGFASKRTAQYRSRNLKALGILAVIAVISALIADLILLPALCRTFNLKY